MRLIVIALLAASIAFTGCRRGQQNPGLPDEDTFFLPSPQEEGGTAQALCASDTAAYDALLERIQTYNEALQERIALIRLVVRATARELERDGEVERTVERDGFTLTLNAVEDEEGAVLYTLTLTNPEATTLRVLEGSADAARESGAWTVFNAADTAVVQVDWTNIDGTLTVDRTATGPFGTRESHYVRTATEVTLDFTGPQHTASAQWDRATKDGSITVDGAAEVCWDASDDLTDFCSVPCT